MKGVHNPSRKQQIKKKKKKTTLDKVKPSEINWEKVAEAVLMKCASVQRAVRIWKRGYPSSLGLPRKIQGRDS